MALRGVPAAQADELEEQIAAHLYDAIPEDADDEQVAAVLARLGSPADLAADAGKPAIAPGAALSLTATWLRRRLARVRRLTWSVVGALVVLAGLATGYLHHYLAPGPLQLGNVSAWWYARDYNREVDTSAGGASQTTVPIRSGQRQGYAVSLYNPTSVTQTILGPGYGTDVPIDGAGSVVSHLGVSVPNLNVNRGGFVRAIRFTIPGAIPPHQTRLLRVLWISDVCLMKGSSQSVDELGLRVRVGWFTRTEVVPLDEAWAVKGPSQGRCD